MDLVLKKEALVSVAENFLKQHKDKFSENELSYIKKNINYDEIINFLNNLSKESILQLNDNWNKLKWKKINLVIFPKFMEIIIELMAVAAFNSIINEVDNTLNSLSEDEKINRLIELKTNESISNFEEILSGQLEKEVLRFESTAE